MESGERAARLSAAALAIARRVRVACASSGLLFGPVSALGVGAHELKEISAREKGEWRLARHATRNIRCSRVTVYTYGMSYTARYTAMSASRVKFPLRLSDDAITLRLDHEMVDVHVVILRGHVTPCCRFD